MALMFAGGSPAIAQTAIAVEVKVLELPRIEIDRLGAPGGLSAFEKADRRDGADAAGKPALESSAPTRPAIHQRSGYTFPGRFTSSFHIGFPSR